MSSKDDALYERQYRTFLENGAKYVTLIGLLSLGAAFVHDFLFWSSIDSRMLSYYVIADHIQTAVAALAGITGLAFVLYALEFLRFSLQKWLQKRFGWKNYYIAGLVYLGGTALISSVLYLVRGTLAWADVTNSALMIATFAYATVLFPPREQTLAEFAKVQLSLPVLAVVVLLATVLFSLSGASRVLTRAASDVVTYAGEDDKKGVSVRASIVRMLDRGVIVRPVNHQGVTFIPRERLIRVDHNSAAAPSR